MRRVRGVLFALPAFLALPTLLPPAPPLHAPSAPLAPPAPPAPPAPLYDAAPSHLWNRIHEQFHVRVAADGSRHGFDSLDPLLWRETRYLLAGQSHDDAIKLLDEFLAADGELLIRDPLKRAVFQNDLWSVFDWLATGSDGAEAPRARLMGRLARVIRRVALTRKEIEALEDNYAAAAREPSLVPMDLFNANGPWVGVGGIQPFASQHVRELGRSGFTVLWSVPGGAVATSAYLRKLWDFPEPFILDRSFEMSRDGELRVTENPALPPIPEGTRIALVRTMLLIDQEGMIVPSRLVQSIQLREIGREQRFSEVKMSRLLLFGGRTGGLRAVAPDEREFLTFSSQGLDVFERTAVSGARRDAPALDGCRTCHQVMTQPAILTVRSLRHLLRPNTFIDPHHERWSRWFTQPAMAADVKTRSFAWGVLRGLWQALPR